ncbi:UNVERIFIED_CONTAM: hypothetical protein Scaly_1462900 [Sesamum calycinum]|uniref:DUF642 domain-containing protein n=1 Tax=Sesamum calycinum TaxID=2727403 RepID=A0AAW2PPH7_9LAMI
MVVQRYCSGTLRPALTHRFKARQGHAVQLGENGRINQTLRGTADGYWDHILSFNLAALNEGCAADSHAAVNVSVLETWKVFFLGRNLSRDMWERYAFYMGGWGRGTLSILRLRAWHQTQGGTVPAAGLWWMRLL